MTIKNEHIKHAIESTEYGVRYLCNHAVGVPLLEKIAWDSKDIVCKRCKHLLQKKG